MQITDRKARRDLFEASGSVLLSEAGSNICVPLLTYDCLALDELCPNQLRKHTGKETVKKVHSSIKITKGKKFPENFLA